MAEPHSRVSFSPELAVNNVEIIETIIAESLNRPTSFNLSTRNLMKIPSEIGLLVRLERCVDIRYAQSQSLNKCRLCLVEFY